MILSFFRNSASIKSTLIIIIVVYFAGVGSGIYGTNKFYTIGKINQLERYIDSKNKSHKDTLKNLQQTHLKQIEIAKDESKISEIKNHVKDNRSCDLSDKAVRMLDNSRTGLSVAAGRTDDRLPKSSVITQRQQIESCAKDGIQYRKLKTSYDGLKKFYIDNWKKKK